LQFEVKLRTCNGINKQTIQIQWFYFVVSKKE
jgi:hypothetical protein